MRARWLLRPFDGAAPTPQTTSPFIGEIMLVAGSYAPQGWLPCDGAVLLIADHPDLYSLLGTTYGGDGVNTFAIPDLRGRIPLHSGNAIGFVIGQQGGTEAATLTTSQIPQHTHTAWAHSASGMSDSPAGMIPARDAVGGLHYAPAADSSQAPEAIAASGGSTPHNNMQPYLVMTYCIATTGIYPSQG